MVRPMPYPEIYPPEDEGYHPIAGIRTMFVNGIDRQRGGLDRGELEAATAPMRVTQLRVLGGAMARVPADATAFAHRGSPIMVERRRDLRGPRERAVHEEWVAGLAAALRQDDAGAYVGFLGDEGEERVRAAYPGRTWDRLARSRPATTRTTSSGSTRTFRRRLPGGQQPDAQAPGQALSAPAHHHVVVVLEHRPRDR